MILRLSVFLIIAIFVSFAASWLAQQQGTTTITWLGYQMEVMTSYAVVAIGALAVMAIFVDRFIRALVAWPRLFSQGWQQRRRQKGETALSLGFVALAAGDHVTASRQAKRAEKLCDQTILTDLLAAQAAHAKGDVKAAKSYFEKLANGKETAYFGELGLMRLYQTAANQGDETARLAMTEAAQNAFALMPHSAEAAKIMMQQALQDGAWDEAREALRICMNHGGTEAAQYRSDAQDLYVKLTTHLATEAHEAAAVKQARSLLDEALGLAPDFVPAFLAKGQLLYDAGDKKGARRLADIAFRRAPQKDTLALQQLVQDFNEGQLISHLMKLAAKSNLKDEAYEAIAIYAVEVGIWASASQALSHLSPLYQPTNSYFMVQAAIAEGTEKPDEAAQAMTQAARAPRAAHWLCASCGYAPHDYAFLCKACGTAASHSWQRPKVTVPSVSMAEEGELEDKNQTPDAQTPPIIQSAAPASSS